MSNNAKPSDNLQPANFIPLTAVTHREVSDVRPAGAASASAESSIDLDKVRERLPAHVVRNTGAASKN
jgi:hypothetical protein